MTGWREIASGVLVRRYGELDLTVGLIVGGESVVVVDTRGDHVQGAELAAAVRQVTPLPWQVVLTHGHFDHCFGTERFSPAPVWAHERCATYLAHTAEQQRAEWIAHYRAENVTEIADALAATTVVRPDHLVTDEATLDLGDRTVRLLHPGPGHTDHDLLVATGDVVFAGDLVEHGAPPDFGDSHPEQWPAAVDALVNLEPSVVVPGHGDPVEPEFVRGQRDEIAEVAHLCREHRHGRLSEQDAVSRSPYPAATTLAALSRMSAAH